MKLIPLVLTCSLILAACGGSGVDTQTLAGHYTGTWSSIDTATSGTWDMTFDSSGVVSGIWHEAQTGNDFAASPTESNFNGTYMNLVFKNVSLGSSYGLHGQLTKNSTQVSGTLLRDGGEVNLPYNVSLTLGP